MNTGYCELVTDVDFPRPAPQSPNEGEPRSREGEGHSQVPVPVPCLLGVSWMGGLPEAPGAAAWLAETFLSCDQTRALVSVALPQLLPRASRAKPLPLGGGAVSHSLPSALGVVASYLGPERFLDDPVRSDLA